VDLHPSSGKKVNGEKRGRERGVSLRLGEWDDALTNRPRESEEKNKAFKGGTT